MPSFQSIFLAAVILSSGLRLWLLLRQMRHVWRHRDTPPDAFLGIIPIEEHRKAAAYTLAKARLGLLHLALETGLLLVFTLGGGLQWLHDLLAAQLSSPMLVGTALLLGLGLISAAAELPLSAFAQFRVEARFGFNRQTPAGFVADLAKQTLLGLLIGGPLLLLVLWLMGVMGENWWLWVWGVWMAFNLLILAVYPTFIAPLFNKFTPLDDDSLKSRIEGLMQRVGFASKGLFVMDGSRRSAHGNAYFSGFGAAKRIVFFDTLLSRLAPNEIEAVLAHELGHFKLNHVIKRIAVMFILSLGFLALLGYLKNQTWFYLGLGVTPSLDASNDAMALILFMMALPVFTFLFSPLLSITSRKNEFEADAFAAKHSNSQDLISALVKLYEDNASTLTPDPLHSAFYDSHPPASVRIQRLLSA